MEGILSGLFHSKKGKSPSKSDQTAQSKAISDTKNNTVDDTNKPAQQDKDSLTSEPNQGKETQESTVRTSDNRSQNMRLSKSSNTNKPADEDFDIPAEPVVPSFNSNTTPPPGARTPVSGPAPSAVIGAKITFKGELTGEEDLLIQGHVEGTVDLKDNHLTVGEQGVVKANLMAKTITIQGTVEGDLIGQERIEIKSSSNVRGNLVAERVTLEDGAKFRGSIDMDSAGGGSLSSGRASSTSSSSTSSTPSGGTSSSSSNSGSSNKSSTEKA